MNLQIQPNVLIRMGKDVTLYKNNVVQGGIEWIIDKLQNKSSDTFTYIAVGDNSIDVSLGDTKLGNEVVRKLVSTTTRETGEIALETYFDTTEANFTWQEMGLFAGGTTSKDSGTLIARVNVNEFKDNLRTAIVSWSIGIKNV